MKRIETFFEADKENYLGFYGYDIFQSEALEITFNNILESNLLADEKENESFGPFKINQLTETDFSKIDFTTLNKLLSEYYRDENWGADLEIFKSNTLRALDYLKIENNEIYYINLEKVRTELKSEINFWSYFIGLVCIDRKMQKIFKIYFGGD